MLSHANEPIPKQALLKKPAVTHAITTDTSAYWGEPRLANCILLLSVMCVGSTVDARKKP